MRSLRKPLATTGLLFFLSLTLAARLPLTRYYTESNQEMMGRTDKRNLISEIEAGTFYRTKTLPVMNSDEGILTAVLFGSEKAEMLLTGASLLPYRMVEGCRVFQFRYQGICIEFSLERPDADVLQVIEDYYIDYPEWLPRIEKYYNRNFVIRIFSAENFIDPEKNEINFEEVITAASFIGDKQQPLWGIHDGLDFLTRIDSRFPEKTEGPDWLTEEN